MSFTAENHQFLADRLASVVSNKPPVRLRASSVGTLFDCAERWVSIHIHGMKSPQRDRTAMGTAIHAGTALFDQEVLDGQTPSVLAATEAAIEALRNPEEETIWDLKRDECESIVAGLTTRYCQEESPKHNFVAVEAKCESLTLEDVGIELTGSVDRVESKDGKYGIADLKSGVQAVSRDGEAKTQAHGAQLGVYEILGEHSTGMAMQLPAQVIGMQTGKNRDSQRIAVSEVLDAKSILLGNENRPGLIFNAALMIHGIIPAFGNPRSMLCTEKYCPNFKNCFYRK